MEERVNVGIRVRPPSSAFKDSVSVKVVSDDPPVLHVANRQSYSFDHIFSHNASQKRIYEDMVKPLVDKVVSGDNCTVFAYGQTGTGKTYTIGSDPKTYSDAGFIARTCDEFFHTQQEITISFYEIYNEKVYDLLSDKKIALHVKGFKVEGLTQTQIFNSKEAANLLEVGSANRHVGETKLNRYSSRSHAIFTITCNVQYNDHQTEAKLNLVDLAGSESVRKTGNEGSQFKEGVNINKGLFYIGRVINALSTSMIHVPYRQSMITTILQDSLNKMNYITLVACISPDLQDVHETIQTLEFAQASKNLKNKLEIHSVMQEYKRNNPDLFGRQVADLAKVRGTPLKRQNVTMDFTSTPCLAKIPKNQSWTPGPTTSTNEGVGQSTAKIKFPVFPAFSSLSPIVQKCAEKLESTMVEKLKEIIRTEIVQLTRPHHKTQNKINLCETTNENISTTAKRLDFDDSIIFKLPSVPQPKPRKKKVEAESLLEVTTAPRRSVRLSRKISPIAKHSQTERRKSTRLLNKTFKASPSKIINVPIPTPRRAVQKHRNQSDDIKNNHHNHILNLLNNGDPSDLQKLASVGVKTSTQICFYRQLSGPFQHISDLSRMPSWRGNGFQRFLKENFLA